MKKSSILLLAATLPVWAAELPPVIPAGPITYDEVGYDAEPAYTPLDSAAAPATDPFAQPGAATQPALTYAEPVTPAPSSGHNLDVAINAYSSNYQVRGMGVTDSLSRYGWSSVDASYTLPNRNLFGRGLQQRFSGTFGLIWGAGDALGDTPVFDAHYGIGKEIFPNLTVEAGYTLRRGGLEGFLARNPGRCAHRVAQDLNLTIAFDDHQRGFFGSAQWGYGFQGLTGHYFDFEAGYRFTDVIHTNAFGADLEVSAGMAPSFGYWGGSTEGMDAYRLKVAALPYTHNGKLGRDAAWQVKPWVQCSWTGTNARKIDRACGYGPADHFQLSIGVEVHFRF